MPGTCVNCGQEFQVGQKGPRRVSLEFLAGKSRAARLVIEEVLGLSDGTITPLSKTSQKDLWLLRFLCRDCYAIIDKIEKKSIELDCLKKLFRDRNGEDTYLREKLESSRSADLLVLSKTSPVSPCELVSHESESERKEELHDHVYSKLQAGKRKTHASSAQKGRKTAAKTPANAPRSGKRAKIAPCNKQHGPKDAQQEDKNSSQQKKEIKNPASQFYFQSKAMAYIHRSQYVPAFRLILRNSRSAKNAFLRVLCSIIKKEMAQFYRSAEYCCQPLTLETLKTFTWQEYYRETRKHLPTLHTVLEVPLLGKKHANKVCKDETGPHVPGFCLLISVLLHLWRGRKFNLIQSIMGVQMYRYGTAKQAQNWMNKAGLCLSQWGVGYLIKKLRQEFEDENQSQKKHVAQTEPRNEIERKRLFVMRLKRCRILKDWHCVDRRTTTTTEDHGTPGEDMEEEDLDEEAVIEQVDEELDEELEEETEEQLDEVEEQLDENSEEEMDEQLYEELEEEFEGELNVQFEGELKEEMEEDLDEESHEEFVEVWDVEKNEIQLTNSPWKQTDPASSGEVKRDLIPGPQ